MVAPVRLTNNHSTFSRHLTAHTGLNLTVASKVICVDLWFNSGVEQQGMVAILECLDHMLIMEAFCRVHRIGQKSETSITRFMVKNTVDEKLIAMQEEKNKIIGTAIDDNTVLSKLSLEELMKLFGNVAYDINSKPFILVEDMADVRPKKPSDRAQRGCDADGDRSTS